MLLINQIKKYLKNGFNLINLIKEFTKFFNRYSSKKLWANAATSLILFCSFSFKLDWSIIFVIELLFNPSYNFCWFNWCCLIIKEVEISLLLTLLKLVFIFIFLFWVVLIFILESFFFKLDLLFCLYKNDCSFSAFNKFNVFLKFDISIVFSFNIFILSLFLFILFCKSFWSSKIFFIYFNIIL